MAIYNRKVLLETSRLDKCLLGKNSFTYENR